ncbi:MAG: glucuronate isomerase, partial [Lachnospiraceae bacterium]|nr:glucuronate isomerase [Lachnospiraceae bacterium]
SGWWFNDNRSGMRSQLTELANCGMLGCFVGMLTDSRSFLSYTRHEYFRRILCELVGEWVESGQYPADEKQLRELVEDICFYNTDRFFGFGISGKESGNEVTVEC